MSTVPSPSASSPHYSEIIAERRQRLDADLAPMLRGCERLVWEVGCGHGHFLTAYAAAHPTTTCIGIDIASDRIERAVRKRDRARLGNLHFVRAEAGLFLATLPPEQHFSAIFVLFPDPWPKARHHKHRLMQPAFLKRLSDRAGEGCRLYFRTDFRPYFEETEKLCAADPHWRLTEEPWPFEQETVFQARAEHHYSLVAKPRERDAGIS